MSMVAVGVGVGVAGIGAGVAGASMQASAAKRAAELQADSASNAIGLQREMFDEQKRQYDQAHAEQEPWRAAGKEAIGQLGDQDFRRDFTMADYQKDPGYDFRMSEGQKALERSAAARGGLQGGGTLKALTRYGQDYASNEYSNAYNRFNADRDRRFNRLSSVAGLGQTAVGQNLQAGSNYSNAAGSAANQMGNFMTGAANAQGASQMAQANAWSGALSGIGKTGSDLMWMSKWNQQQNPGNGTTNSGGHQ